MIRYKGKLASYFFTQYGQPFDIAVDAIGEAVTVDDWVLAVITSKANISTTKKVTLPVGWTWIVPQTAPGTGTTSFGLAGYRRAADDTTYTFALTTPNGETINPFISLMWGDGAAGPATWVAGAPWARLGTDTFLVRSPSITTTVNGSSVLAVAADRTIADETEVQVNVRPEWTDLVAITNAEQFINFGAQQFGNAGETTGEAITDFPNAHSQNGFGIQIEAPPAIPVETTGPEATGITMRRITDTGIVEGRLKVITAAGLIAPKAGKQLKPGYPSVTAMLTDPSFRIAHRGGSRDFPEMSLYAYSQSALMGYGALELSLGRTSDGVWFGMHDKTFQRTSGDPRTPSDVTWAQVQQMEIAPGPASTGQIPRPYARWEEIMETFYESHVLFIDPKEATLTATHRQELYGMMEALPGNPRERLVGKYYGVTGGPTPNPYWFPEELAALGYKSWGFFYETDLNNIAAFQNHWAILGMEYSASQATWGAIKSHGKPVIGHIVPTLTDADTALSKGADGLMVSGVKSVPPKP